MTDPTGALLFGGLLAHLAGDYVLQSDWMATRKTARWTPAIAHGLVYALPFAVLTRAPLALLVIAGTHIVLDHYRVAKYVLAAKNVLLAPKPLRPAWPACVQNQGSPTGTPAGLATALLIVTDNTIHLAINSASLLWLR